VQGRVNLNRECHGFVNALACGTFAPCLWQELIKLLPAFRHAQTKPYYLHSTCFHVHINLITLLAGARIVSKAQADPTHAHLQIGTATERTAIFMTCRASMAFRDVRSSQFNKVIRLGFVCSSLL
jgi:hypothetical protein